jgi:putative SOS response-associated peptidase YedK
MCYFNGTKVTRSEKIRLQHLEKLIANYEFFNTPLYIGPDFPKMPMMRKLTGQEDFEIVMKEWGFLPPYIQTEERLGQFRSDFITLNAKVENLFTNDKGNEAMFAQAALQRRCLIPSTHFFEWRHVNQRGKNGKVLKSTIAYPYLVRLKEQEMYYFAGIWNPNNLHGDNFSLVTTEANLVMSQIHNLKKRMPTILTEELAWEWLFNDKLSSADIQNIGSFQIDSSLMEYYTVEKNFKTSPDPMKAFDYPGLPPLGEDVMGTAQLDLF